MNGYETNHIKREVLYNVLFVEIFNYLLKKGGVFRCFLLFFSYIAWPCKKLKIIFKTVLNTTWHKEVSKLGEQETDNPSWGVGYRFGRTPVGVVHVVAPDRQLDVLAIQAGQQRQRHSTQL